MYVVSLDPGQTTGVCLVRNRTKPWELQTTEIGPQDHHVRLLKQLSLWKPDVLIVEDFDNRSQAAAILTSKEYIGVAKAYAQGNRNCTLVLQHAGNVMTFWNNDKLRKYGVYFPGRHARDACRHYLHYRTFTLRDMTLLESVKPT